MNRRGAIKAVLGGCAVLVFLSALLGCDKAPQARWQEGDGGQETDSPIDGGTTINSPSGPTVIEQNDSPPLGKSYPSQYWRSGQTLVGQHTLPANSALDAVAVGLYTRDGTRLSVTHDGQPVPDNRIVLPIDERACQN